MKILSSLILSLLIMTNVLAEEKELKIGLIGDSTVADTYGWGPAFAEQVGGRVKVLNFAKNGATLQSLSGRLDELLKAHPDYVLVQFGHNDQKRYDDTVYAQKLTSYVTRIKKSGAKAVVLSSVTRRGFDEHGRIKPMIWGKHPSSLPRNAKAAEAVAKKEKVPFLDLYAISVAHHNKIGPDQSASYNFNKDDRTHFSKKGAAAIASLVLAELKIVVPALADSLRSP